MKYLLFILPNYTMYTFNLANINTLYRKFVRAQSYTTHEQLNVTHQLMHIQYNNILV